MTDASRKSANSGALRLLQGVAMELRGLAEETMRFGETLSSDAVIAGTSRSAGLLQKFDLYVQNLQAHALLIENLSTRVTADEDDVAALHDLIGHIPFFRIRERLRARLSGAGEEQAEQAAGSLDEDWF